MNLPNNTLSDQLDVDVMHDVFSSIWALDAGISNHEVWIGQLHQSLICENEHANPADLYPDAHCHCKFGQWLYSTETETLKQHASFDTVEQKHQQMHDLARHLLDKTQNSQRISEQEYCDFTAQAMAFKLEVRNLQYLLMSQVCVVDHLTGAWNRYAMYSKLNQEKERLERTGHPCSICMMDIDYFKRINDNHGHAVGDQVLREVINFCRTTLRKYDSIYRYGGEEFLFILPDAEQDETRTVIKRLCDSLREHSIPLPEGESLAITASFGIASMQKGISVDDTIRSVDHALLCAKAKGRDCVCDWED